MFESLLALAPTDEEQLPSLRRHHPCEVFDRWKTARTSRRCPVATGRNVVMNLSRRPEALVCSQAVGQAAAQGR